MSRKALVFVLLGMGIMIFFMGCMKKEVKMAEKVSPIIDQEGADPSIIKLEDMYYYTKTTGNNIVLSRAESFLQVASGEKCVIYEPGNELRDLWAPEIQYLDGAWYIYFAAVKPGEEMHHMYVLSNENRDPFEGSWSCSILKGMDDKFSIDGMVFEASSKKYFVWSGWEGYENVQQNLYIAEMLSPVEVRKEKILLSSPEYEWEKCGIPLVNEGPEVLIKNDTINLLYSASGSWTDGYCLGLITANIEDDLKNPRSWKKEPEPVLCSENGVYGPGHNGFTVSADGTQDILLYHAARWQGAGWSRSIRFGYLSFDRNGKIEKMRPAYSGISLQIPSGEKERERYYANTFEITGAIELEKDEDSTCGKSAVGFLNSSDEISLKVCRDRAQKNTIYVFVKNQEFFDDSFVTEIEILINEKIYVVDAYPSAYYQPISVSAILKKGENVMSISSVNGGSVLCIDRIEILKQ